MTSTPLMDRFRVLLPCPFHRCDATAGEASSHAGSITRHIGFHAGCRNVQVASSRIKPGIYEYHFPQSRSSKAPDPDQPDLVT